MARPPQDAIETFMSITGASEPVALRKLEEHGGDLNEAVNAHFNEGDRTTSQQTLLPARHDDFMEIEDPVDDVLGRPPLLPAAQNLDPFSLLDSNFRRSFFDGGFPSSISNPSPRVSHPREVREIPIEFKDNKTQAETSGHGPTIEDVTGNEPSHGPEIRGTVIIDDDEEDDDEPLARAAHDANVSSFGKHAGSSASPVVDVADYSNDIEEEMIRAAIEASKRDAEGQSNQQIDVPDDITGPLLERKTPAMDDADLARAVSLSLEFAEQERALRQQEMQFGFQSSGSDKEMEDEGRSIAENGRQRSEEGNIMSVQDDTEDMEEQPLVRHRSRRVSPGNAESTESGPMVHSPPSSLPLHNIQDNRQYNGDGFPSEEWGGISSEEHDEAVMLEAAMFGGIPEGTPYQFSYPRQNSALHPPIPRPPSPSLTAQRLLREQQDDEYLASLLADQEKELKAKQEAERRQLEEAAARKAALEKERQEEEEARRKQLEEEEYERKLAAKEASLPQEPSSDDESAVTLLVRMPDGSRRGRRFLKSDKLQFLFDFIDIGRVVKPGTYRLVRPYPRRAFADGESELSLSDLGLTSKQEALFLELI
ncbi:plant UBX domain-containing protein 8 [Ananas comosus]|uniref:Plant UBX domain-containing protein 8 n=1 Tax=Ananas comosus TaxID=4615 RepID=A0A6P5HLH4_ANACO|nr:plant UBX domain-containing protein 8 [Ananas comosus]